MGKDDGRPVAHTFELHSLHVCSGVVENELRAERMSAGCFRTELVTDHSKGLASNHADVREGFEGSCRVLHCFVDHWSVAGIANDSSGKHRLTRRARAELQTALTHLNHGDEWLRAWCEGMANQSDSQASRRIHLDVSLILVLVGLHRAD